MLRALLRVFFRLLYHEFAWLYDLVADFVSIGRWSDWIRAAIPFVQGGRILELAYGTGILQVQLRQAASAHVVGIDESRQMARLARRRLQHAGQVEGRLTVGCAQALPFRSGAFDAIVATFPTEFILAAGTLEEARRVLTSSGRMVVVAAAWIVGRHPLDRLAAWLFRRTHQSPPRPAPSAAEDFAAPMRQAGFDTTIHQIELRDSSVLIVIATR